MQPEARFRRDRINAEAGCKVPRGDRDVCFCYIVECSDGSLYTGWTTDPEGRIRAHNAGRGSRYTRARRPVRLVLLETQAGRAAAMRREHAIKEMTRARKLQLIASRLAGSEIPQSVKRGR